MYTIVGKQHKQALVSLIERKSYFSLIYKVERKTFDQMTEALSHLLLPIRRLADVHTVISDNGKEFAGNEILAKKLDTDFYFAHPYSSFERSLNENTSGLIRQYFPIRQLADFQKIETLPALLLKRLYELLKN